MKRLLICAALLIAVSSCIKRTPPVHLSEPTHVRVAYVVDGAGPGGVSDAPEAMKKAVEEELSTRNLIVDRVGFDALSAPFSAVRDTPHRFEWLRKEAGDSALLLLVELRTEFFSEMQGQYRWQLYGKLTAARSGDTNEPFSENFDVMALMQFDHERTPEVLVSKAPTIAEHAGLVMDNLLRAASVNQGGAVKPSKGDEERPNVSPKPHNATPEQGSNFSRDPDSALGERDAIYFVMVDRFANGDPSNDGAIDAADPNAFHGGDLQGVIDHLDYLKALGVGTVWLSPVFKMRTEKFFGYGAFHGYWTYDLNQVEPRFGSEAKLKELADGLHARGMRLVLDLVLNHVGPDAPLQKQHPDWFHNQGPLEHWDDPNELVNKDVLGLPDFKQENEEVYRYLLGAALSWIDRVHPDGFRLDAVKHMPTSFWARFNADVKKHAGAGFMLLGEYLEGDAQKLARVEEQGGFTNIFDFPLHFATVDVFCKGQPPVRLAATLSQDVDYADPASLVTLVDNHDLPRIMTSCGDDVHKVEAALSFSLTARGTPSLIWGTEAGLRGEKEPQNRGDMKFDEHSELFRYTRSLLDARAESGSLRDGVPYLIALSDQLFAYARLDERGGTLILVNPSAKEQKLPLDGALLSLVHVEGDLSARPMSVAMFRLTPASDGYARFVKDARRQWRTGDSKRSVHVSASVPSANGDPVFLVGSGKEFGSWDPSHGLGPLKNGAVDAKLPEGFAYEYKLVIRRRDGKTEWEPGANRALFVEAADKPLNLSLRWAERNG